VSCEVLFEREFFSFDLFKQVFADMIEICEETIDTYVGASYDCIALSLMLIIVEQVRIIDLFCFGIFACAFYRVTGPFLVS
jgi:hypothetical protein